MQAPIEALSRHLDRVLTDRFQASAAWLGVAHLLVVVALTLFLAWFFGFACGFLSRRFGRASNPFAAQLLATTARPLRYVTLFIGLSQAVEDAWPAARGPGRWVAGTLFVVAIIVGVRALAQIVVLLLKEVVAPKVDVTDRLNAQLPQSSSARALLPLLQRVSQVVLWLSGLILILDHFGQNVSSVVAALGVTSLAIGLASQQALSNIIAGLVLAIDHPFRVGDRIRLPGTDSGEVLDIGMRATQIRLADGSLLIVPNTDLLTARLINLTHDHTVRAEVRLSVSALLNVSELAEFLVAQAAKLSEHDLADPPPKVQLLSVADKVDLALIFWLNRTADLPAIEENLRRQALLKLQELLVKLQPPRPA